MKRYLVGGAIVLVAAAGATMLMLRAPTTARQVVKDMRPLPPAGAERRRHASARLSSVCSSGDRWSARDTKQWWAPEIDGLRVVELLAEDGDRVAKDQVLARLDRSQLDALLAQNDAALARADAAIAQARNQKEQYV